MYLDALRATPVILVSLHGHRVYCRLDLSLHLRKTVDCRLEGRWNTPAVDIKEPTYIAETTWTFLHQCCNVTRQQTHDKKHL